ncbi:MAG: sugar ABC transporter ATP-binding protein, partial [Phycisphaerae bacterium]|nr:sugar ABC transporter ATP-binding protein [Phycisphaerae bacterium]
MVSQASNGAPLLLEMRGIDKSFTGVHALKGVDLTLRKGQVLALLGENGAGKSTLIKVLGGAHLADIGSISIEGKEVRITDPHVSQGAGISIIYQEFNLIPALTVRENIFLGREKSNFGFVRKSSEHEHSKDLFRRIGLDVDPNLRCEELTIAQQQTVEIAKALSVKARIIVMDEPSAALTSQEVEKLFEIVRDLKARGIGIIYISHRLEEIFEIADRVMVLRDGQHVATCDVSEIDHDGLVEMMVGRKIENEFPTRTPELGEVRLEVSGLNRAEAVKDVSFSVRSGEILTMTGLVGAGRTETARLIFGADRKDSGTVRLDGRQVNISNPRHAIANRICLLTEDRKAQGLILVHSVRQNFGLPNLARFSRMGFVDHAIEKSRFQRFVESMRIKVPNTEVLAENLSGSNQQTLGLAKGLENDGAVINFDAPTRGIDVGAKYEIYVLMNELAAQGKAII